MTRNAAAYAEALNVRNRVEQFITANYTPNPTVEQLKSRIAWLEGMVDGFSEMYKRGYIEGGIGELTKKEEV